jgi:hypothetical protein
MSVTVVDSTGWSATRTMIGLDGCSANIVNLSTVVFRLKPEATGPEIRGAVCGSTPT